MKHTPADGTYAYQAPYTGAEIVAHWQNGTLTHLSEHGDARSTITPLTAEHVAHELSYAKGVTFTAPAA